MDKCIRRIKQDEREFLFDGRSYMSIENNGKQLLELEKEQKFIGSEYDKIFQLEVLYDFYESRGLPRHTIGIVKNLSIGNECVIASKDAIRIKRLSKSFYYIEEHNQ